MDRYFNPTSTHGRGGRGGRSSRHYYFGESEDTTDDEAMRGRRGYDTETRDGGATSFDTDTTAGGEYDTDATGWSSRRGYDTEATAGTPVTKTDESAMLKELLYDLDNIPTMQTEDEEEEEDDTSQDDYDDDKTPPVLNTALSTISDPPPAMSPNEELTLLATRAKPNSPDHDDEGMDSLNAPRFTRGVSGKRSSRYPTGTDDTKRGFPPATTVEPESANNAHRNIPRLHISTTRSSEQTPALTASHTTSSYSEPEESPLSSSYTDQYDTATSALTPGGDYDGDDDHSFGLSSPGVPDGPNDFADATSSDQPLQKPRVMTQGRRSGSGPTDQEPPRFMTTTGSITPNQNSRTDEAGPGRRASGGGARGPDLDVTPSNSAKTRTPLPTRGRGGPDVDVTPANSTKPGAVAVREPYNDPGHRKARAVTQARQSVSLQPAAQEPKVHAASPGTGAFPVRQPSSQTRRPSNQMSRGSTEDSGGEEQDAYHRTAGDEPSTGDARLVAPALRSVSSQPVEEPDAPVTNHGAENIVDTWRDRVSRRKGIPTSKPERKPNSQTQPGAVAVSNPSDDPALRKPRAVTRASRNISDQPVQEPKAQSGRPGGASLTDSFRDRTSMLMAFANNQLNEESACVPNGGSKPGAVAVSDPDHDPALLKSRQVAPARQSVSIQPTQEPEFHNQSGGAVSNPLRNQNAQNKRPSSQMGGPHPNRTNSHQTKPGAVAVVNPGNDPSLRKSRAVTQVRQNVSMEPRREPETHAAKSGAFVESSPGRASQKVRSSGQASMVQESKGSRHSSRSSTHYSKPGAVAVTNPDHDPAQRKPRPLTQARRSISTPSEEEEPPRAAGKQGAVTTYDRSRDQPSHRRRNSGQRMSAPPTEAHVGRSQPGATSVSDPYSDPAIRKPRVVTQGRRSVSKPSDEAPLGDMSASMNEPAAYEAGGVPGARPSHNPAPQKSFSRQKQRLSKQPSDGLLQSRSSVRKPGAYATSDPADPAMRKPRVVAPSQRKVSDPETRRPSMEFAAEKVPGAFASSDDPALRKPRLVAPTNRKISDPEAAAPSTEFVAGDSGARNVSASDTSGPYHRASQAKTQPLQRNDSKSNLKILTNPMLLNEKAEPVFDNEIENEPYEPKSIQHLESPGFFMDDDRGTPTARMRAKERGDDSSFITDDDVSDDGGTPTARMRAMKNKNSAEFDPRVTSKSLRNSAGTGTTMPGANAENVDGATSTIHIGEAAVRSSNADNTKEQVDHSAETHTGSHFGLTSPPSIQGTVSTESGFDYSEDDEGPVFNTEADEIRVGAARVYSKPQTKEIDGRSKQMHAAEGRNLPGQNDKYAVDDPPRTYSLMDTVTADSGTSEDGPGYSEGDDNIRVGAARVYSNPQTTKEIDDGPEYVQNGTSSERRARVSAMPMPDPKRSARQTNLPRASQPGAEAVRGGEASSDTKFTNLMESRRNRPGAQSARVGAATAVQNETVDKYAPAAGRPVQGSGAPAPSTLSWSSLMTSEDGKEAHLRRSDTADSDGGGKKRVASEPADLPIVGVVQSESSDIPAVTRVDSEPPNLSIRSSVSETSSIDPEPPQSPLDDFDRPGMVHAVSAQLVSAQPVDVEAARARLREQAERDAIQAFENTAISVDALKIEEEEGFNWRLYGCLGCLLVVIVVVVVSIVATREKPTGPTLNDICSRAIGPLNTTSGFIEGIIEERAGQDDVGCQVTSDEDSGFGLWYTIDGEGSRLSASTCTGSDGNSDTQVMVFAGNCNNLQCIGGSDQLCGNHGSVGWVAEEGTRYFILVRGYRRSNTGPFTLATDSLVDNGSCANSASVDVAESPFFGSTRNLTIDTSATSCGQTRPVAPGAWYRVSGDDSVVCASVQTDREFPLFPLQLSVYEGAGTDCDENMCIDGVVESTQIAWQAKQGLSYYVNVHGDETDATGDFILNLRNPPGNGICETAQPILPDGGITSGSLVQACQEDLMLDCNGILEAPGVWYEVDGNGSVLVATLSGVVCERQGATTSRISVFTGSDCSGLQCSDEIQGGCLQASLETSVRWFSEVGEKYYLYVQSSSSTIFDLAVEEIPLDVPDSCTNATQLKGTGDTILGSTVTASRDDLESCSSSATPGVFYLVEGTGGDLFASTCNKGTNFPTSVSILSGGCESFACVSALTVSCDGIRSITYWPTVAGEQYFVHVHGVDDMEQTSGRFNLTLGEGVPGLENDFCPGALELEIPSTALGSTAEATMDDVDFCGQGSNVAAGVWFFARGTGNRLTASMCGDFTDYDTQIYVYTGTCDALQCIASNDDFCSSRSEVTWESEVDEVYYILISGFDDVGNFEITIAEDP